MLDALFAFTRRGDRFDLRPLRSKADAFAARLDLMGFVALALVVPFLRLSLRVTILDFGRFFFVVDRFAGFFAAVGGLPTLTLAFGDLDKYLAAFPDDLPERLTGFLVVFLADFLVKAEIQTSAPTPQGGTDYKWRGLHSPRI